jgi:hypothetical protein
VLLHRLAFLGPIRAERVATGFLQAPYGAAAVAFMQATGLPLLKAWDAKVARASQGLYDSIAQDLLAKAGGYLVESIDGLTLAAFPASPPAQARRPLDSPDASLLAKPDPWCFTAGPALGTDCGTRVPQRALA